MRNMNQNLGPTSGISCLPSVPVLCHLVSSVSNSLWILDGLEKDPPQIWKTCRIYFTEYLYWMKMYRVTTGIYLLTN